MGRTEDAICWAVVVQLQLLSAPWDAVLEDGGWGEFGDREKWADVGRPKDKRNEITGYKQFKDGVCAQHQSFPLCLAPVKHWNSHKCIIQQKWRHGSCLATVVRVAPKRCRWQFGLPWRAMRVRLAVERWCVGLCLSQA
jgi:hypothetical protein